MAAACITLGANGGKLLMSEEKSPTITRFLPIFLCCMGRPPTPAMPEECKIAGDSLGSYHKYYIEKKNYFAKWTDRPIPTWYVEGLNNYNANLSIS